MCLWATKLTIFNNLDPFVLAPWAFKSAPIVVWLVIRFNRNEPHLRVTSIATRAANYPWPRNDLNFAHGSTPSTSNGKSVAACCRLVSIGCPRYPEGHLAPLRHTLAKSRHRAPHRTARARTPFSRMLPRVINRVLLRKSEWIHRQRHQIQRDRMRDFQVSAT